MMPAATLVKRVSVIILLAYLGFGFLLFFRQTQLIYYPTAQDFAACPEFSDSQKMNSNGTRFYYKNISDKLIVFYHGNAGSACDRAYLKDIFSGLGYSSIFVEYAGYAKDAQPPSQTRIMQDVEHVHNFLKSAGHREIVIVGESLGASLALYHSSLADEDQVLLISPFYSLEDVTRNHYPVYPVSWMLRDKYESNRWLTDLKKIEVIHGAADTIVPITGSKKLFNEMAIPQKKFIEVAGANHNDMYHFPETFSAIADFLSR